MLVVLLGAVSYLILLFVIHGFTYRTWVFHVVVIAGLLLGAVGWLAGGSVFVALFTAALSLAWFVLVWSELGIRGSDHLKLRPGDPIPAFSLLTTHGVEVTERDVVADGPALLVFYRGWWCPSHKPQLDELLEAHEQLADAGLAVFAGSVDSPEESRPIQDRVGDKVTILCGVSDELLDEVGLRDERGAPWYDRFIFGAKQRDISMPAAIVADDSGRILYAYRSNRIDERATPAQILSSLSRT
jgi:peroxiredoxin